MKKTILALILILALCAPALAEGTWTCPKCAAHLSSAFTFCPYCLSRPQTEVSRVQVCKNCAFLTDEMSFIYCPMCATPFASATDAPKQRVYARANQRLATRSGPSTAYSEPGTFYVEGEYLPIISIHTDNGGTSWVQTEITDRGEKRRVYTGIKRFDMEGVDLSQVAQETAAFIPRQAKVSVNAVLRDGPGSEYAICKQLMLGEIYVTVYALENGWAQVEFTGGKRPFRTWVEQSMISFQ